MEANDLRRRQLDANLRKVRTQLPARPKSGWISEVRRALMMTSEQLAKRLGIDQSTLSRLEKSETQNTITLNSLQRAAKALGCELHYTFVPIESLEATVSDRAAQKLADQDKRVNHTMALEGQQTDYENQLDRDVRAALLVHQLRSRIWDD